MNNFGFDPKTGILEFDPILSSGVIKIPKPILFPIGIAGQMVFNRGAVLISQFGHFEISGLLLTM